jgi:Membrane domain of glycerophosphoryl diester phosphodiesterase
VAVQSSETPQLRPLSVGEALDAGLRLFRHRFGTLVLCTLVFAVPFSIASTFVEWPTNDVAFDFSTSALTDGSDEAILGQRIAQLLQAFATVFAIAACFKAVSAAYLGERASAGASLRFALPRLGPVLVAIVLTMLILLVPFILVSALVGAGAGAAAIGAIAAIVLVAFLGIRLALTMPPVVIERKGPVRSIGRSWRLTSGHYWRTFAVLGLASLLTVLIGLAGGAALGAALTAADFSQEATAAVLFALLTIGVSVVTTPIVAAVMTVHYYDMRVRNEGFDLELLARGVGADEPSRFSRAPERPEAPAAPEAAPTTAAAGFSPPQGPTTSA